jgi:hypothetical protein
MEEKERLIFNIERFDNFYDSVNNKSAVFLGLATFIIGGLFALYPFLLDKVNCNIWIHSLMASLIGLGIGITIIVILASTPYLSDNHDSLLYFNSISNTNKIEFQKKSAQQTSEEELMDLRNQVHELAKGLTSKFKKLRIAGILFTIQFILFIPLTITIMINLK